MTGLLVLVSAFAALGAAGAAAAGNVEQGLRGGRSLQETPYCNSIGCSDGYTPIPEAWMVECDDNPCEESQCCEAFCSYHACPSGYTPVVDAATIECDDSGCTTDLCCDFTSREGDSVDNNNANVIDETPYCNSIGCSDGYTPIPEAWMVECDDDPCEESQCCEAFCSYFACPDGSIPIEEAQTTECPDSGCTEDLCCV